MMPLMKKKSQSEPYSRLILAIVVREVTPDRDMVDPFTLSADLIVSLGPGCSNYFHDRLQNQAEV